MVAGYVVCAGQRIDDVYFVVELGEEFPEVA
jgi:hypothetical protein